jgi:hypothetical protein
MHAVCVLYARQCMSARTALPLLHACCVYCMHLELDGPCRQGAERCDVCHIRSATKVYDTALSWQVGSCDGKATQCQYAFTSNEVIASMQSMSRPQDLNCCIDSTTRTKPCTHAAARRPCSYAAVQTARKWALQQGGYT